MAITLVDITDELPVHPTKHPKYRPTINRIILHTTDMVIEPLELAEYDINPNHISSSGCPGITYSALYYPDGRAFKTAPWNVVTWHAGNWNKFSLGIAMVYKTDPEWERAAYRGIQRQKAEEIYPFLSGLLESVENSLVEMCIQWNIEPKDIRGHREMKGTGWFFNKKGSQVLKKTCPGMAVDMKQVRSRVARKLQVMLKDFGYYKGAIDGAFGRLSKAALAEASSDIVLLTGKSNML